VDPGELVTVTFANGDPFGQHNIVFELDAGRVVSCDPVGLGNSKKLSFLAPSILADYPYYSSVGADRPNGMTGTLHVGTQPTATPPPSATARATGTARPSLTPPAGSRTPATATASPGVTTSSTAPTRTPSASATGGPGTPSSVPPTETRTLPPSATPPGPGRVYLPDVRRERP
jgi:hypothetical protein